MTYTTTPVLGMKLPVVGSGQAFETTEVNANFLRIDTGVGDLQTAVTTLGGLTPTALPVPINQGGTNATTESAALTNLGMSTYFKTLVSATDMADLLTKIGFSTVVKALLVATTAIGMREAMRFFKNGATFTPATDDLKYTDL